MTDLIHQSCQQSCVLLTHDDTEKLLSNIHSDWYINTNGTELCRRFVFSNYYQTLAFINAAAQVAHKQDHHPAISFAYKQCDISYSTHSVGGLSLNDFICAAKTDLIDSI